MNSSIKYNIPLLREENEYQRLADIDARAFLFLVIWVRTDVSIQRRR